MTLSVVLLTRNEEKHLARALASVAGLADQLLVVDTGSTDATVEIATRHGADVRPIVWDDDFAAGCNFALEQATGDWVFWLNPHEELLPASRDEVRACLARDDVFAYGVWVQELTRPGQTDGFMESLSPRLFRRHPEVRYVGRAFPDFVVPLPELAQRLGQRVDASAVRVRNHAYESRLDEGKMRWIARLLEAELRDRPGRLLYLVEYGHNLLLLNDPRGHDVLAEAARQLLPARDAPQPPGPGVPRLLEYLMTVRPEQSRSPLSRQEARELALRWFPATPPMLWRAAEVYYQAREFGPAAQVLEQLVRLGRTGAYDRSQAFDPGILGDAALTNLGVCYLQLGQLDRAERCLQPLLASPTHAGQAQQHLQRLRRLRAQSPGAGSTFWVSG